MPDPDSENDTLRTLRIQKRATVIMVCFQNVSSSDVQLIKATKKLHPTKCKLASCPEYKVPFDKSSIAYCVEIYQPVQFSPGY